MMNSTQILKRAVEMVAARKHKKAIELVREHFESNKVEAGFNKEITVKRLKEVIALGTGKKEPEMEPIDLLHMGLGNRRKVTLFTDGAVKALKNIIEIVGNVKQGGCGHSNAKVIPLLYGGGFTPIMVEPELVCPDCGLNVTLTRQCVVDAGVPEEYLKELYEWGRKDNKEKGVQSSNNVMTRPREILEQSKQWDGDMEPIFAVIRKLEPFSGQ